MNPTDVQDEYLKAGADGIIPKPVHQKSVLEQIKLARKRVAGETKPKALQPSD
jgi:DNA-binding response OmpR family regulator